jgi:hypothetical protein
MYYLDKYIGIVAIDVVVLLLLLLLLVVVLLLLCL